MEGSARRCLAGRWGEKMDIGRHGIHGWKRTESVGSLRPAWRLAWELGRTNPDCSYARFKAYQVGEAILAHDRNFPQGRTSVRRYPRRRARGVHPAAYVSSVVD